MKRDIEKGFFTAEDLIRARDWTPDSKELGTAEYLNDILRHWLKEQPEVKGKPGDGVLDRWWDAASPSPATQTARLVGVKKLEQP